MPDTDDNQEQLKQEEVLLRWSSPSRLFKKRDKEYYKNIGAIVFLLVVIMLFAREYMLVVAVLAIVFFIYVTSTIPPENIDHKITNLGLESAGRYYRWDELVEFWFEERWGQAMVSIKPLVGTNLLILIDKTYKDKIHDLMAQKIPFREQPQKTWVDNAANWLTEKIPLEKPS
jgi:hypothetical protein